MIDIKREQEIRQKRKEYDLRIRNSLSSVWMMGVQEINYFNETLDMYESAFKKLIPEVPEDFFNHMRRLFDDAITAVKS